MSENMLEGTLVPKETFERVVNENTILRGLVAKHVPGCIYCGESDMSKCKLGFPGCGKMDDIFGAHCLIEEDLFKVLILTNKVLDVIHNTGLHKHPDIKKALSERQEALDKYNAKHKEG